MRLLGIATWGIAASTGLWSCRPSTPSADAGGSLADAAREAGRHGDRSTQNLAPADALDLERAEDARRSSEVAPDVFASVDLAKRRRAARALARIADERAATTLLTGLHTEDPETLRWVAYGLGYGCKGREDAHVRALAARVLTLLGSAPGGAAPQVDPIANADVLVQLLRAMARCGTPLAENSLAHWLRDVQLREAAALALGDLATRKKALSAETMTALLDVAASKDAPLDAALYPLSRAKPQAFTARLAEVSQAALARSGPYRIFAIRALSHAGPEMAKVLGEVVASAGFSYAERAEAAKGLGAMGDEGKREAGALIPKLLPGKDPFAIATLAGAPFSVLYTLVTHLSDEPPKSAEAALFAVSGLLAPGEPPAPLRRRLGMLRCAAALGLARGGYDAPIMTECDDKNGETWARARVTALVRRPLVRERRAAWTELARSKFVRVREDALDAFGTHPELSDVGRAEIARALEDPHAGVVTAAAQVLFQHPERAYTVSAVARRAALDPKSAPPDGNTPDKDLDPGIARALKGALTRTFAEDLVETRALLLDAAVALRLPAARNAAEQSCRDVNATIRTRAEGSLRAWGEKDVRCTAPSAAWQAPPRTDRDVIVVLSTDAGDLKLELDADVAPVTVARVRALVEAGFYKGVTFHRVVPGFVAQFGDPGGDGYGGSGRSLRCETSPEPFDPLSVGVALAGRDTGSSQLFVTLARTPHLDGDYTWLGTASGDWGSLAEGDVIQDAKILTP
jgi:cyclophilin family peptidyl-prolyl cis-trans isomerase